MGNTKALEDLIGKIAAIKWNGGYDRNGSHDAGEYVDYEGAIGEVLNHDQMHAIAEWVDAQLATNQQLADILTLCGEPECFAVEYPVEKLRALIDGLITLRTQLAERDAQLAQYQWKPIGTVPDQWVLAYNPIWSKPRHWHPRLTGLDAPSAPPTHWMHLPDGPATRQPTQDKGE